jgi:hypothetical protein
VNSLTGGDEMKYDVSHDWDGGPMLHICADDGTTLRIIRIDDKAVKYLEHGREMRKRIKHHCDCCALGLVDGKDDQCKECYTTILLAKLEVE